ncbi:MAG: ArnT family glycosyltransferase [Isosphaerales bacterium]
MRWSRTILILLMLLDVWYRAHTFGGHVREGLGISLWPRVIGASEPLDCDEAAYAYIGHRILHGDVLYRDLTENKPPLGYWIYTLAVALGGYNELTIRVMPIPFILATIALVWWIANRLGGRGSACLAAGLFMLLSTDPYLFGNGANLEHLINFFGVASLALFLLFWDRAGRWLLVSSGVCLGAAALVKQVAIVPALIFALALVLRSMAHGDRLRARAARGFLHLVAFALGIVGIAAVAATILIARGAGQSAFEDIFQYGRALATDTLTDPNAPWGLIRWITGNADPAGQLPWPFGGTDYLVWWGSGSWPLWLASIPALAYLLLCPGTTAPRRLLAGWTLAAWAQVILPGLYWPHYYLLPIAGVAMSVALCLADATSVVGRAVWPGDKASSHKIAGGSGPVRRWTGLAAWSALLLASAIGGSLFLQIRDYLLVPPEELTIRYKGGRQWVVLRAMGRELGRRATIWAHPRLYVWGWQSPLHFYSGLDGPTRHFFVDNLLRDQADRDHPLIKPRTEEIIAALRRRLPELIFTGYAPFRALRAFLNERYLPSRLAPGLWVKQDEYGRFELIAPPAAPAADPPTTQDSWCPAGT